MEILLLFAGLIFLVLLNLSFNRRPEYPYLPPTDGPHYHPDRRHYFREDPYLHIHRSLFPERFAALFNTLLFVLLLAAVIVYYGSSNS